MPTIRTILSSLVIIFIALSPRYSSGQFINGDFSSGLLGWYTYGDISAEGEAAILRTGGLYGVYDTSLYTTFVVSGDSLNFRYYFDIAGADDIMSPDYPSYPYDSFQVTIDDGNDGYLTESLPWAPSGYFIPYSIDISNFSAGTVVTLSFDLMDQDDGFKSIAAIDDVDDPVTTPVPEPGTLILLGGGLIMLSVSCRYKCRIICRILMLPLIAYIITNSGPAYGALIEQNADDLVHLEFRSPLFNTRINTLSLNMVVSNVSDIAIYTPLKVIITGISSPDVSVANPDGYTEQGLPYYNLTEIIADHVLSPGEESPSVRVLFYNPKRIKFRWDQDVLAFVDTYIETGPVIENICLVPGEFPPVCEFHQYDIEVEDPAFDKLLMRQLPDMYIHEQVRVYAYDYEELPLNVMINDIDAAYNEDGFYYYSDIVLQEGLNTISISVTNEAGVKNDRDVTLNIDTIPPEVIIIRPEAGAVVTSQETHIEGYVDDPSVEDIVLIEDYVNSRTIPVINGQFTATLFLKPGHNNTMVEASDTAGNYGRANLDIIYAYSETSDVSGRILSGPLGLPLSGAAVTILQNNGERISVMSDNDGIYRADGVRSGDVTIVVDKDGYTTREVDICILGGDSTLVHDIALQPFSYTDTVAITGAITDTAGHPLEGATVAIAGSSLNAISDNNGIYLINNIPRSSFEVISSSQGYDDESIRVNPDILSPDIWVLTHDFVMRWLNYDIGISYPVDGASVSSEKVQVRGFIRSGDSDAGVRVNGIMANVYSGYFTANNVGLAEGSNYITAETLNEGGTMAVNSIEVNRSPDTDKAVLMHAHETGIVPLSLYVHIEPPPDTLITSGNLVISGPSEALVLSKGPLRHSIFINEAGIYNISFSGVDESGRTYNSDFGFTAMTRDLIEGKLKEIWREFKEDVVNNDVSKAMAMITPETRYRYQEQFIAAGQALSGFFSNIGDIQLVTLNDNMAKTRIVRDGVTNYIWFGRDIYGLWKIHKF